MFASLDIDDVITGDTGYCAASYWTRGIKPPSLSSSSSCVYGIDVPAMAATLTEHLSG